MMPVLSIWGVSPAGAVSLIAANVPYASLQWTRRVSSCGEFCAELACASPVPWPGRYLVTLEGHDEVGVVEKLDGSEGSDGEPAKLSGRFAECLWDRYRFGAGGASVAGANWRQAVTAGLAAWHMGDIPRLAMGEGTQPGSGGGYVLAGDAGKSGMETIYGCASGNGAYPLVTLGESGLVARIVTGLDRTRGQAKNPICLFSLMQASASKVSYCGDWSPACSELVAHAEKDNGDAGKTVVDRTVPVPGFDAATMWRARAYEDVGSLIGQDQTPTAANVDAAGALRAYDHQAAIATDAAVTGAGYREHWDLCDLCEVEMPSMGLAMTARIEEVREVYKPSGGTVEATVGTKRISRIARAMMGRR